MHDDLTHHQPSDEVRRRARAAGLELDRLRSEDPDTYRMLCSTSVLRVGGALRQLVEAPLHAALPDQRLFEAEAGERVTVLAFPGPTRAQLERLDDLLALAVEDEVKRRHAYYRVVQDTAGVHRELDLPTPPESWSGEETMVGPFRDEAQANAWAEKKVDARSGATFDVIQYAGGWFCDVFRAGDG